MYIYFSEEKKHYYVKQFFGYSLSYMGKKIIKDNNLSPFKTNIETINDPKKIHKTLLNMMIFSEHYIEESLYYKKFIEISEQFDKDYSEKTKHLSSKELESYCKGADAEFEKISFATLKSYLSGAKIVSEEKLYKLPYTIDEMDYGFRFVEEKMYIFENGIEKMYYFPTKSLSCIIENDQFIHIEPLLGFLKDSISVNLESPRIERNIEKLDSKEHLGIIMARGHEQTFSDAIEIGLIKKK